MLSEPLPLNVATYNTIKKTVKFNARYRQNTLGDRNLLDIAAEQSAKDNGPSPFPFPLPPSSFPASPFVSALTRGRAQ